MVTNSKTILLAASLLFLSSCEDGGVSGIGSGECNPCTIFATSTLVNGNLGGIAGADAKCAADSRNPGDGIYKALIGGSTRRGTAGSQLDWVIKPSTAYQRSDGTLIAYSTASGLLPADLVASIYPSDNLNALTGLGVDGSVKETCSDWTSSVALSGTIGLSAETSSNWIDYGNINCSFTIRNIYCVQQ